MKSYGFDVDCPGCGGDLVHVTGSTCAGSELGAIASCSRCRRGWQVSVFLRPLRQTVNT